MRPANNKPRTCAALLDIATATRGIVRVRVSGRVGRGYDLKTEHAFVEAFGARYWEHPRAARRAGRPPPIAIESVVSASTSEELPGDEWARAEPMLRRALGRASANPCYPPSVFVMANGWFPWI